MAKEGHTPTLYTIPITQSLVNTGQLVSELNNDAAFDATCTEVLYTNGKSEIKLWWSNSLTVEEQAQQNIIMAQHMPAGVDIEVIDIPHSEVGSKLWVHSSAKPEVSGKSFFVLWTSAGDDLTDLADGIGKGEILQFNLKPEDDYQVRTAAFNPFHGDTYIHEGYLNWTGGGEGDHITGDIIATATPMQPYANLDMIIEDNWIKYSPGGPGTGTHGLGGSPTLIKRAFSGDGDWDYSSALGLRPNFEATGMFKISDIDRTVHRFVNRVATFGDSNGYVRLVSEDTSYMAPGYIIQVECHNVSGSEWTAGIMLTLYRERTYLP
jgi:hypothetical protein